MQWRGKRRRRDYRLSSSRFQKGQFLIPANLVENSHTTIEVEQVCAAAEQDVLAIVNDLSRARMLIRRGPATEIRAALK
jgi:hypothetical protein